VTLPAFQFWCCRYIGVAKIVPNVPVPFTPHPASVDPDIGRLARRFTSYYLQTGYRLFVSHREGTFPLNPDPQGRPFIFDAKVSALVWHSTVLLRSL
jgi:hypothetical protein